MIVLTYREKKVYINNLNITIKYKINILLNDIFNIVIVNFKNIKRNHPL